MAIFARLHLQTVSLGIIALSFVLGSSAQALPAAADQSVRENTKEAKLNDEFGRLNSEDRSARFDSFFQEISQNPESVGYVFLYCGKKCRYGEIEAHLRGIELKVALRKFNRSRLIIVNAGFREVFATELWFVPKGACPPKPKSTVNIKYVVFSERGKYSMEAYDCCDDFSEVWRNYKP